MPDPYDDADDDDTTSTGTGTGTGPGGVGLGSIFSGTGTGDSTVIQKVVQLPGMKTGELGTAGLDRPGPSVRTVAVPAWQYIGIEILWAYLHSFLGILAMDGMGLINLAPAGEAFQHLYTVAGVACGPSFLALLTQLYQYLGKVRASRV